MNLLLLALALGLAGASPLKDDKVCQPHSRPWQVYLRGGGSYCSGALIDKWWIVTSASCAPTSNGATVSLGEHDITVGEGTEQHIPVADVIRHGPYRSPVHNLAMVRLAQPARLTQYVQPIPLPSRCPRPGETCYVSGWGSTTPHQYARSHLKCITVPVVDDQTCENSFPRMVFWSHYMFCAGQANTDNCLDDSGAVMLCDGQLQGVQWYSFGCRDPAESSTYSKICLYNNWIESVMSQYTPTTTKLPLTTTRMQQKDV